MNVQLTQDYRITTSDRNFVLQERRIVDPRNAPGYKPPADGTIPEIRETWRDAGYYSLTSRGLTALLDSARMRMVAASDAASVAEMHDAVWAATNALIDAINAGLAPEFTVSKK